MLGVEELGQWIASTVDRFADYLKPYVLVDHYSEAVILRFGKYRQTRKPGLWFKIPLADYPMTDNVKPDTMEINPITVTTLDGKTVTISMMIHYEITDIKKFIVDHNDARTNMNDIAGAELSDYLEDCNWDAIKKKTTKNAVQRMITPYFDDMGVAILDLKFKHKAEVGAYKLFNDSHRNVNAI